MGSLATASSVLRAPRPQQIGCEKTRCPPQQILARYLHGIRETA
jgi:hypothetical protein